MWVVLNCKVSTLPARRSLSYSTRTASQGPLNPTSSQVTIWLATSCWPHAFLPSDLCSQGASFPTCKAACGADHVMQQTWSLTRLIFLASPKGKSTWCVVAPVMSCVCTKIPEKTLVSSAPAAPAATMDVWLLENSWDPASTRVISFILQKVL